MVPHLAPEAAVVAPRVTPEPQESLISGPLLEAPRTGMPPKPEAPSRTAPPVLKRIAFCESGDRHFDAHGNVIRGKVNPEDIGRFQINQAMWGKNAEKLGYDIFSEEGNLLMALYLYEKQGTRPWVYSQKCWDD
jgi:hypothetical protein